MEKKEGDRNALLLSTWWISDESLSLSNL